MQVVYPSRISYLVTPWEHQLVGIERALDLNHYALFYSPGCGKTATTINILRHQIERNETFLRTLIFCPPIVVQNWKKEFGMHSRIDQARVIPLVGSSLKRLETFKKACGEHQNKCIFVTNYEALLMKNLYEAFRQWRAQFVVFDESHRLKNPKATGSKLAEALANPKGSIKPYTYILSGTPILNSPLDIFFQFLVLDGGTTFGKNYFVFRARYFVDKNAWMTKDKYFPNWVPAPGALEKINELIFKCGMRATKEECLDLPDEVFVTVPCAMTAAQAKNYAEMKKDFIAFTEDSACVATMALTKALRLMQITSGFMPTQNLGETEQKVLNYERTPKEEALHDLLEELAPNGKVIVWAVWRDNYRAIRAVCEALKLKYVQVHGEISRSGQDEAVRAFNEDEDVRVFIGHPGSGGIGINLVSSCYSIFYSRTFSLEQRIQACSRNHRSGQKNKVTHYDLVCSDSIDTIVQKKLLAKEEIGESMLSELIAEVKKHG